MTAPKLTPEQRVELAATLGEAAYVQALEAERDSHRAMLQELHGHVAAMCERLGVDPVEVPADSWTLRDRILAIIAERDTLQKRVGELEAKLAIYQAEMPALPAYKRELTTAQALEALLVCAEAWEPRARLVGNVQAGDIRVAIRELRARAAHNEACAKWVREHGACAVQATANKTESWGDMLAQEAAVDALRALLKDEET